ncbi:MAG: hypothetical protein HYT93_01040 [Parcubacteria group bacterium]|nr:hypothetical protein [Parcubacteria group bacterium]
MRLCCTKETSASPDTWTPKNPLWGHCAAVSLVAQNMFGGTLLRVSLTDTPFKAMRSHYFNKLPDGTVIDFTKEQFGKLYPSGLKTKTRTCGSILEHESTRNRYKKLALRFAYEMTQNVLLLHPLYGACFEAALDSGCQKLWVGSVLVHNGVVVSSGNNHPVEELAHVCKPKCIRFNIQSRTESMIGACGHAEEYAMWEAIQKGIPLSECDMYVAMVGTDGLPRFRSDPSVGYTCLRCATAMRLAGIKNVYIDIVDHWEKISIKDALQSALQYALGEKKL